MKKIYFLLPLLFVSILSHAQLSGTKAIPGDYVSISAAITALNAAGVGGGGVTFNVAAGYTETAANLMITATGTSGNPITFQKSGSGANPLITAVAGVSATLDGIIILRGTDYITFNGIDLKDPATNVTATTQMEWGYALLKSSGTDGCQYVTITNCTITLQRINTASVGIYSANNLTSGAGVTVTSTLGANSYNKFYSNVIQNVKTGISITGFADASPYTYYDQQNDVGGLYSYQGNTIQNFGGIAAIASYGINDVCQNGHNISNNTINNLAGGGVVAAAAIYGILFSNSVNAAGAISYNNINLSQGANVSAVYCIYSGISGTGTVTMGGNVFSASFTSGASGSLYCIYMSSAMSSINLNTNTFSNSTNLNTTGPVYFISNNTTTPTVSVSGNTVNNVSKVNGAGGNFTCYYNGSSPSGGTETVNSNSFTNISVAGATTFGGINTGGTSTTQNKSIYSNTVSGINGGSSGITGIYVSGGNVVSVYGNVVSQMTGGANGTGSGAVYSYNLGLSITNLSVYNNTANNISNNNTGWTYGFYFANGTTFDIHNNSAYKLQIGANGATAVAGFCFWGGSTVSLYNNYASNLTAPIGNSTLSVAGIYIGSSSTIGIYDNTIYLDASSSGATFATAGIYTVSLATVDMHNNNIVNISTPNGVMGYTAAYARSSTTLSTYSILSNNNNFYAGTPSPKNLLFYDGTNAIQTLDVYKAFVAPRDQQSVSENPPFTNVSTAPYDLHLKTTVSTACESGGTVISSPISIVMDYDNDVRYPNGGYPNNVSYPATAPDIGFDEFAGMPLDVSGPVISYTALINTSSTTNRTLTATITDVSGVPTAGIGLPRLYWKINSGTWNFSAGNPIGGNQYTFTFGAGVITGDIVSYYVAAQDNDLPTPLSSAYPAVGASGYSVNPPAVSTPTTSPSTYTILGSLCGTYTVGVGKTYATLTAAITDLNAKEITCPVIFQLTDATYGSETFPITINPNIGSSVTNTVTIRPASGVTSTISGSSASGIIILNGADYIIIDGSNSGGLDKSLTIENTNTSANRYAIGFSNAGGTDPAKNNVIKNCNIKASSQVTNNTYGIYMNSTGGGYDNTVISNNTIYSARYGIFFSGSATVSAINGQIINNIIGSTTDATSIQYQGIVLQYANGTLISGNEIMGGPAGNTNYYKAGIYVTTGSVNTKIRKNKIHDWFYSGTGGYGDYGIYYGSDASTVTEISNNLIYLIKGDGWPGVQTDNPYGIYIANGGNCQIWFNSIYLTGAVLSTVTTGGCSACLSINPSITGLDVRNNIFKNSMQATSGTPADYTYAVYCASANTAFTTINNNDYYDDGLGANIGYLGANQATLAAWQIATAQDAASLNVDPAFVSTSDLHTYASGLAKMGVTISSITDDFAGVTRTSPPDVGAYQFSANPVMTTTPATFVACSSVTLNGTINPSGASVTTGFDYGTTVLYGSSVAGTPATVTGSTAVAVAATVTDMVPNVVNHYRIKGTSGGSTFYGSDMTVTPPCPPVVVTTAATGVTATTATMNGTVNALNLSTTLYFEWGLTSAYGSAIAATPSPVNGSSVTPVSANITGLMPNTTYHYRLKGTNSAGSSYGLDMTFTTLAIPPTVVTTAATAITSTTATLNGTVKANYSTTNLGFDYGLTTTYGNSIAGTPSPVIGGILTSVSGNLAVLTCNTLYHYRVVGVNVAGTSNGNDMTFTTGGAVAAAGTITGATSVCRGATGVTYTIAAISGATGYVWSIPTGGTITSGFNTTTITVSYSGSAISGNVTVYGINSCMNGSSSSLAVTVNLLPVPTITGTASACVNSTGNIYYTESGMTGYTWSISAGGTITAGGTSTSSTVTVTWNIAGAQTVSVNYTNGNGCLGASATIKNVTVNALPVPTITGLATVCAGTTGVTYTTETGMTGYTWSITGGTITAGAGTKTITVTWNTVGSQTVTVSYTNTNGCTAASPTSKTVTVNALPVPTITGSASVCAWSTGNVYTTESGMTGYTWALSGSGIITSGAGTNAITVTWTTAGTQYVSVNYTNTAGCTAASATSKTVIVNPLPVPTITGAASACAGATGVTYTTETGMTGYTWTITSGGTITAGAGTNTITVTWNTAGLQTVTVNYVNTNGCTAATATSKTVTVNALPVPTITGLATVCAGTTGVTYYTQTGMTGYTWTVSSGGTITAGAGTGIITVTWTTPGSQTVTVSYTNTNGCTAASPTVKTVTVNALPVPTITGSGAVCAGTTGVTYSTETGMTGYTWTVSAGGTITAGGGTSAITVTWNTVGAQTVSVNYTNTSGCTAATATVKNVTVNPLPVPTITGLTSVCAGTTGVTYTTETGMTGYTWIISSGGTITAGAGTATITVTWTTAGTQYLTVNYVNANGCTAASPTYKIITVNALPVPAITGTSSVCVGTAGATYTTQPGMMNYVWTVSSGGLITAGTGTNSITVTWNTSGTKTVSVIYTNTNGCTAATPGTFTVTVNPLPVPTITGSGLLCQGATGVNYYTESGMTGYTWTISSGGTITAGAGTRIITVTWTTAGAQTLSVTYTNANGCTPNSPTVKNITVNPVYTPTLTGTDTLCLSTQSYVYTTESGMNNYSWNVSSGGTIMAGGTTSSSTVTVRWNTSGTQYVRINYANSYGCSSPTPTYLPVIVYPVNTPAFTGPNKICAGTTGCVYTTYPGMTNYNWTVSSGGTITAGGTLTSNTVTVTWNTAGTQYVTLNYTNTYGCTAASPYIFYVVVNPLPAPTITGPVSVCVGTAGNVYYTQTGMTNYVWNVSPGGTITSGGTSVSPSVTVTWTTAGTKYVSVNYTNSNGCTAAVPGIKSVTVNPLPTPTITGPTSLCSGVAGTFYTQTGNTSYIWTVSTGGTITAGGTSGTPYISVKWTTLGAQWVRVSYTSPGGCKPTTYTQFNTTVYGLPTPTVTGPTGACQGSTGNVYTTQAGMTSYTWTISTGGTITAGAGTNSITVTWNGSGTQYVRVNYTNANGCSAANAAGIYVTVTTAPVPTITGTFTACTGATLGYYTESGMTNYVWTVSSGGTIISGQGTRALYVQWTTPGAKTISVNYSTASGCQPVSPTVKTVNVYAVPVPTITGPTTVCVGAYVTYSTEPGMSNYTWTIGGTGGTIYSGFYSSQIYVKWTYTGAKTVSVNYTAPGGCRAPTATVLNVYVTTCADNIISGVDPNQLPISFSVYPNPNNGKFTAAIQCECIENNCSIAVFNMMGVNVFELSNINTDGKLEVPIDLQNLAQGIYTVIFRNNNHWLIRKIVINK
ncbi:MAG: hypothetical protein NTU98_15405 [Bacteroidetes bacterium]|nr:hypothetical protein [Bacteroidota bacterium]